MPLTLRLSFALAIGLFVFTIHFALMHQLPLPFSDSMDAMARVVHKIEGKIDWLPFLLKKHGEHFHASIYALLYIDTAYASGQHYVPLWAGFITSILFFVLLCRLILQTTQSTSLQAGLILFSALMLTTLTGDETWVLPFQSVVVIFRFCLMLGIMLYAHGISRNSPLLITLALGLSGINLFFHGGGVIVPLLLSLTALLQARWRYALLPLLLYILFFIVNHWVDAQAPHASLSIIVEILLHKNPASILYHLVLGIITFIGLPLHIHNSAPYIGAISLAVGAFTITRLLLRRRAFSVVDSIWASLMAFSIISAVLAALLTITRAHNPEDFGLLYSSRYIATSLVYWISLAALLLPQLRSKTALSILVILCIVATLIFLKGAHHAKKNAANFEAGMNQAVLEAKADHLSEKSALFLIQPSTNTKRVAQVMAYYRAHHLSIFHE